MVETSTIGKRIEKIMTEMNLNFRSLGKMIGFSDVVVGNVVKGRNKPGFDFIAKLIRTFDWINVRWLILGEGEMRLGYSNTILKAEEARPPFNILSDLDKMEKMNLIILDQAKEIWELRKENTYLRTTINENS